MSESAHAITPKDGPVAVTGSSGYIGSWIVDDLARNGYTVHACVRDLSRPEKVDHLTSMNNKGYSGSVELFRGDIFEVGSYDDAFGDCSAVMHAGATVGYNRETPQEVYDGCFTEVERVLESAVKSTQLKRFVFTSSFAAVGHPRPEGYVFTESDWCGDNIEAYRGRWSEDQIPLNRDIAYAKAKARAEKMLYAAAEEAGTYDAISILPLHVIGPLMCENHDQGWSWQNCMKFMMLGKPYKKSRGGRMLWNMVDVRDVGASHRLAAESTRAVNSSRYILSAHNRYGELFTHELQAAMQRLYPDSGDIGGEEMEGDSPKEKTYDSPRSYCSRAIHEIGLDPFSAEDTIKATIDSYVDLGMI